MKVGGAYADKFKPAKDGWFFARTATNGDMKLTQTEHTGIEEVKSKMEDGKGEYYDLQGREVAQPAKGLYIVNGKKVIIK